MEIGNILVGGISIVAIVVPFIYMYRRSKRTERGLMKTLKEYAEKNDFQLDKSEAVANLALGLDSKNNIAFFTEVAEHTYDTRHVVLSDVAICKANREVREVDYHGEKDRVTHSLEVDFYPKNKKDEVTSFILFDEAKNRMLSGEIQLAKEWVTYFNALIK